jgi:hypothetical protein
MTRRQAALLFLVPGISRSQQAPKAELVRCDMIWGRAPHNGSTDLVRFHDRWFCVFREGRLASSPDGALRVLTSADGEYWESLAVVASADSDLRNPTLSATPDGRLLLLYALAVSRGAAGVRRQSVVCASADGKEWSPPRPIGDPGRVLWRVAWCLGRAYVMGYDARGPAPLRLYTSADGLTFSAHSEAVPVPGEPTEASLLFLSDGDALCLLRREGSAPTAQLGRSRAPYRAWTWTDLNRNIAGPNLVRLPDERYVAAGRLVDDTVRTSLCWLDPEKETLTEFSALPSSGDTGYPGLGYHDGFLWVSYFSSHEGKAMIYLAQVKLPPAAAKKVPSRITFGN